MNLARGWILFSTWAVLTALALSALHCLNGIGYAVALGCGLAVCLMLCRDLKRISRSVLRGIRSSLRRGRSEMLPMLFCLCVLVSLLVGIGYPPTNSDAISYRGGRVAEWLHAGSWQWIDGVDSRMNFAALNHEFIWIPFWVISPAGLLLFLPNLISFALLPGAAFLILRGCGMGGRAARQWMYILPMGWCYIHSAAGTGNDLIAATFAAWGLGLLFRWCGSKRISDLLLSFLSMSLCFGTKQTTWFLILPYGLLLLPRLHGLLSSRQQRLLILAVVPAVLLCSPIPSLLLNWVYAGTFLGWDTEPSGASAWVVFAANSATFLVQNFAPPIFPFAPAWNTWIAHDVLPRLPKAFSDLYYFADAPLSLSEPVAGFGLLPSVLLMLYLLKGPKAKKGRLGSAPIIAPLFALSCFAAWLALMILVELRPTARYSAPYYLPFACGLLAWVRPWPLRRSSKWMRLIILNSVIALMLASTLRKRPLWPVLNLVEGLRDRYPNSQPVLRFTSSFTWSRDFRQGFIEILGSIPKGVNTVAATRVVMLGLAAQLRPDLYFRAVPYAPTRDDVERVGASYLIVSVQNEFPDETTFQKWMETQGFKCEGRFHPLCNPPNERNDVAVLTVRHDFIPKRLPH